MLLPELSLQGSAPHLSPEVQRKIAVRLPGPEIEPLRQFARAHKVHLAASLWEDDPDWSDIFFQTGILIAPSGEIVLKHRKLYGCRQAASPFDFYSAYAEKYGPEVFFQVADTELGKIGISLNEEIFIPENARCLAFRGVEVICHLTAEPVDEKTDILHEVKVAASAVNGCFLVCADTSTAGRSVVTDWMGRTVAASTGPSQALVSAPLDIERIRFERTKGASIAGVNASMWAKEYRRYGGVPIDTGARTEAEREKIYRDTVKQMTERGLLKRSALKYSGAEA